MACLLKRHGDTPYEFTASAGKISLKIVQPADSHESVLFNDSDPQWSIEDQDKSKISYQLSDNNETLQFTAVAGRSYALVLPYLCLPSSCYGRLQEDCPKSVLNISLISVNASVSISIMC